MEVRSDLAAIADPFTTQARHPERSAIEKAAVGALGASTTMAIAELVARGHLSLREMALVSSGPESPAATAARSVVEARRLADEAERRLADPEDWRGALETARRSAGAADRAARLLYR